MKKTIKSSNITIKESIKSITLNQTDIVSNSNKFYSAEIVKGNDDKYYLFTTYGRVGNSGNEDYRACYDLSDAENEFNKIVKSKIKKGYQEVKLASVTVGSDLNKQSIKQDELIKLGAKVTQTNTCTLALPIQNMISTWYGSMKSFVTATLDTNKCALGTLSLDQINKGRDILLEARKIVGSKIDIKELNKLSSAYYSNIPMNLGRKIDIDHLRLDTNDKLDQAFDTLDSLQNVKDAQFVINSDIDKQYKALNTELELLDHNSDEFKWIDIMFHKTRADNHHFLGKMRITNVLKLKRVNEEKIFNQSIENYLKFNHHKRKELPDLYKNIWKYRFIDNKEYDKICENLNILQLFHGSQTQNIQKILSSKLMIRAPGCTYTGSMYGDAIYHGFSSKAINYSSYSKSYWAQGTKDKKAYLFLSDVILGSQTVANYSCQYTAKKIHPNISVWAKGGLSGVINDEFMTYTEDQNLLKYIIEFEAA